MATTKTKRTRAHKAADASTIKPGRRPLTALQAMRATAIGRSGYTHAQLAGMCDPKASRQAVSLIVNDRHRSRWNHVEEAIAKACMPAMGWEDIGEALDALGWEPTPRQVGNAAERLERERRGKDDT